MAIPSFLFGGDTKETPASIKQKRDLARALLGASNAPRNIGEGLNALGDGIVANVLDRRANAAESAGTSAANDIFNSIIGGGSSPAPSAPGATGSAMPAVTPSGNVAPVDLSGNDVYNGFIDTVKAGSGQIPGITNPFGLAAVAATGRAESGFNPKNANRTWSDPSESGQPGTAGGIMSWRGPRYDALAATGDLSPAGQGKFFLQENPQLIQALNNAKSVEEAQGLMNRAWAFRGYDKPGGEAARRLSYAQSFLPKFQGQGGGQEVASLDPAAGMPAPSQGHQAAAMPPQGGSLLDRAIQEYPILRGKNIGFVNTPTANSGGNMLESWPAGEPGDTNYPRPKELPIDQFGVQVFDQKTTPRDLAADVVSHELVNTDPALKSQYDKFAQTFNTPEAQARLREDYAWAQKNENETRPFDLWASKVRIPEYFRGYTFQQWPARSAQMFTPAQRDIMDQMGGYISGAPVPAAGIVPVPTPRPSAAMAQAQTATRQAPALPPPVNVATPPVPPNAQLPVPQQAPQQVAQAAPQGQFGGVDPRLLQALQNPFMNEGQRAAIQLLVQQQQQAAQQAAEEQTWRAREDYKLNSQRADPAYQLDQDYKRAQLTALQNKTGEPLVNAGNGQIYDPNTKTWLSPPTQGGTGSGFRFGGNSVEAQSLNGLIDSGQITPEQAQQLGAGKTITGPNGEILFLTPQGIFKQPGTEAAPAPQQQQGVDLFGENSQPPAQGVNLFGQQAAQSNPQVSPASGDTIPITAPKAPSNEQLNAAGFADRMHNAGQTLDDNELQGLNGWDQFLTTSPFVPNAIGNSIVGKTNPDYQVYDRAKRDFINAQLRRESGAVIGREEFENADKQYFPQPGDSKQAIEDKRKARQLAIESMTRSAGPTYKGTGKKTTIGGYTVEEE